MKKAFTLIELILYLAIVSVIFTALVPFAWNVIEGGVQSGVEQEVASNAWFVMEKIKSKVRNAKDFTVAENVLTVTNQDSTTSVIQLNGTKLQITEGGNTYDLNSDDISITGLSFISLKDSVTKQLQVNLTVNSGFVQTRSEYQDSVSLQSGVELRSI